MTQLIPEALERYAEDHTTPLDPLFGELREHTYRRMQYPEMQVGKLEGSFLRMLVKLVGARRVLELGMFTGYSALAMAEGLPEGGELVTCDINPRAEQVARSYFDRSPHGKKIQIRMGPALQTLQALQPPFDLAFVDADKENYPRYYEAVLALLRPGGLLVADNTLWSGRVLEPQDEEDRAIVEFNQKAASDPRVEAVLLTVRDGMMLVRKR
jgi:caffeoyl-CoA O-methyltransferase